MKSLLTSLLLLTITLSLTAQRQMEHLSRGLVAIRQDDEKIFLSWRLLATDAEDVRFNVYRVTGDKKVKLNKQPLSGPTHFIDDKADLTKANTWHVCAVTNGKEQPPGKRFGL